jgi:hypothetical protein
MGTKLVRIRERKPKKDYYIGFQLDAVLYDEIVERAASDGRSISDYIRKVLRTHCSKPEITRAMLTRQ